MKYQETLSCLRDVWITFIEATCFIPMFRIVPKILRGSTCPSSAKRMAKDGSTLPGASTYLMSLCFIQYVSDYAQQQLFNDHGDPTRKDILLDTFICRKQLRSYIE
ncbi:hypothetical protein M513_03358 [Trichuris suis]|uniref:Uncharacterized protein n=1 Tax=Trichuris suis TaxID=68888 RepID=A0A085MEG4_9BILA|nr:hypothetical protein M513_03358 [Trichuris suis]